MAAALRASAMIYNCSTRAAATWSKFLTVLRVIPAVRPRTSLGRRRCGCSGRPSCATSIVPEARSRGCSVRPERRWSRAPCAASAPTPAPRRSRTAASALRVRVTSRPSRRSPTRPCRSTLRMSASFAPPQSRATPRARMGQTSAREPKEMTTSAPAPSWSVLKCCTRTRTPRTGSTVRATSRATSSERGKAPPNPSRTRARSQRSRLATVEERDATVDRMAVREAAHPGTAPWVRRRSAPLRLPPPATPG